MQLLRFTECETKIKSDFFFFFLKVSMLPSMRKIWRIPGSGKNCMAWGTFGHHSTITSGCMEGCCTLESSTGYWEERSHGHLNTVVRKWCVFITKDKYIFFLIHQCHFLPSRCGLRPVEASKRLHTHWVPEAWWENQLRSPVISSPQRDQSRARPASSPHAEGR